MGAAVVRSCVLPVSSVSGEITTIEAVNGRVAEAVKGAWIAGDVPQCGYCQPGQIMAATALLRVKPKPTDADIDEGMTNICRCGTYPRIRAAIRRAAEELES
jgi:isoquinoline 1-oxidoreductase alpha subunit